MTLTAGRARELLTPVRWILSRECRMLSAKTAPEKSITDSKEAVVVMDSAARTMLPRGRRRLESPMLHYRHLYPEFLPDPDPARRNFLREKLERADMMRRRNVIDIPEFYVGSVLAVTISDPHAQGKTNRFVGICIDRSGCGLRAEFILRNIVNHQGIEVRYELYDPAIQKIQVLRLEKRLDDKLLYLRDALPEHYTFPFDMDVEILPEGTPVPVNSTQVKLKPRPWLERWERQNLKGVSNIEEHLKEKDRKRRELRVTPWEKFDLMKTYRKTIPEEEQSEIWSEVYSQLHQLQIARKKLSRKKTFNLPPSKLA